MPRNLICIDGNEAAGYVAYKTNEVICIYPITPSSNMGELADEYASQSKTNIWGTVPLVYEMQSEGGAAGAIHGSLQSGALSTTFTASQGLLLMIPNMFKIAGELTSTVFHVAARTIATQAISIYGDHSDVMSTRSCGWAMMASNNPQEVMDFALVAQASTLKARVPFMHFFDGFRTSHEVSKIEQLADEDIKALVDDELVRAHRARGLAPEKDQMRGILMNTDTFFQARESVNRFYMATPEIVQANFDKLAAQVGRQYKLFEYVGAPDAERVVILMGSGCGAVEEAVNALIAAGEKVGMVKVRLYRPFSAKHLLAAIPATATKIAVLDRTKEPGSQGEPLYIDVMTAIAEATADSTSPFAVAPRVVGGRYGVGGKEFTPAMAKGVYDELKNAKPLNHFTIGIEDDVTHLSLPYDPGFDTEAPEVVRALFWGLGADGTVGANKNSIKIIGEETDFHAQGFFCYDSKKSGSYTVSHLRFGPKPINSSYLISRASFVAIHQWVFLEKYPVLAAAGEGATVLLASPYGPEEVWNHIPKQLQEIIVNKKLKLYVIDGFKVARETGMGARINTIMQTCFFAISGVLPREEAIAQIKKAIYKTYGKRGEDVVEKNYAAVDATLANLYQVNVPSALTGADLPPTISPKAPEFLQNVTAEIMAGRGDLLPVSALPPDGTYPRSTTKWEKRNIAQDVPVWDNDLCIQCGKCVLVCPHAAIRSKIFDPAELEGAPEGFLSAKPAWKELADKKYTLQVAVEDCTGCALCVEVCPAKSKADPNHKAINMAPQMPLREQGAKTWEYFLGLKDATPEDAISFSNVKNIQLAEPYFEFSGACSGCGETPYVKLATQLFGDRMMVANATGCSSVYGGSLPTTPWAQDECGRGPAWSNSLFEDNAEFGLGMRLSIDKQAEMAKELVQKLAGTIGETLAEELVKGADESTDKGIAAQRARVDALKAKLEGLDNADAKNLIALADNLVMRSVWIMGGDGWAYDIGYGGLDHVIASGKNVNILVLDTEVYSNTGGQASKATPRGAVARFAAGGKAKGKKDLGQIAMTYGDVYVAQVAMGANDAQTMKAFMEADAYPGVSIIIAYSHCVAHGISDMSQGLNQQKLATECGHWPLYRFNPSLTLENKNPLQLDSKAPKIAVKEYAYGETRYKMLEKANPVVAARLMEEADADAQARWKKLEALANSVYKPQA